MRSTPRTLHIDVGGAERSSIKYLRREWVSNQLEDVWKKLEGRIPDLKQAIEDAADSTLAKRLGLDGTIRTLGNQLVTKVTRLCEDLKKLVEVTHHKDDIRLQSDSWNRVDSEAVGLHRDISDHDKGIRAQRYFEGFAGKSYTDAVGETRRRGKRNERRDPKGPGGTRHRREWPG